MSFDEMLAARIRTILEDAPDLSERRMFGGLAFMIGGNMAVAASGQGGLMVRVDPTDSGLLIANSTARPMEMRGREMRGWLRVDEAAVESDDDLRYWVVLGTNYARSLPTN